MMTSNTPGATDKEKRLFTVEGRIEQLRKAPGTVNLIEDIQKRILVPGVAAALAGQAGMLANAASLALYDGEDVEHFAFLINEQLAVGTFEWIEDLRNGDDVKLVVSNEGGVLCVHALLRKSDQLLWMPYSVDRSRRGWIAHGCKLAIFGILGSWALLWLISLFLTRPMGASAAALTGSLVVLFIVFAVFMSIQSMLPLGRRAEDIFSTLGVPRPTRFNLKKYALSKLSDLRDDDPNRHKKGYVFKFADAVAAHANGRGS